MISQFVTWLAALVDWRARAVLRRNARVHFRNWKTGLVPPAMEPVVFFLAFGVGVGGLVGNMMYSGHEVAYADFVAPGLLAYTAFGTPFFEGLYGSYVRMFYQKTWSGILVSQVELEHIISGEILWTGVRATINTSVVALVLLVFDLLGMVSISVGWLFFVPPLAFICGCVFGAGALIFTVLVPSIDHMNFPVFLIAIPLGLVSDTYFPIPTDNDFVAVLANVNPVFHLSQTFRALLLDGHVWAPLLRLVGSLVVTGSAFLMLVHYLSARRIIRDS